MFLNQVKFVVTTTVNTSFLHQFSTYFAQELRSDAEVRGNVFKRNVLLQAGVFFAKHDVSFFGRGGVVLDNAMLVRDERILKGYSEKALKLGDFFQHLIHGNFGQQHNVAFGQCAG